MQNRPGAVVLLSGGLDSTVLLAIAIKQFGRDNVTALTLFYGQKHDKEMASARNVAAHYGIHHIVEDMSKVFTFSNSALLQGSVNKVPQGSYEELASTGQGACTYVPYRNGLFLSYATAIANSLGLSYVAYGAHANDSTGAAYPDCSPQFFKAQEQAIATGTGGAVRAIAPLLEFTKVLVLATGLEHKAPLHLTWSCYEGRKKACGKCATCIDRLNAFEVLGRKDVIEYETNSRVLAEPEVRQEPLPGK